MSDKPSRGPRVLASEYADDPEMREIVQLFVSELPDRIALIQSACNSRELSSLRRTVHQLKGASAGYGFPTIGQAAGAIEDSLRQISAEPDGPAWQTIKRQVDQLLDLCRGAALGAGTKG